MSVKPGFVRSPRRGAAFLILIVLVLLVIVGATKTMVTSEVAMRQDEVSRSRAKALRAAIDVTLQAETSRGDSIRLPVDPSRDQWIDVSIERDVISAVWRSGDHVQQKMVRKVESVGPSGEQN